MIPSAVMLSKGYGGPSNFQKLFNFLFFEDCKIRYLSRDCSLKATAVPVISKKCLTFILWRL